MSTFIDQRVQSSLNLILPIKSWLGFEESSAEIHFKKREMAETREDIGTLHFARFVELREHNHLGYFTVFDGDLRTYYRDFINDAGPAFDAVFKHVVDGPPVPCESKTFIDWSAAHHQEGIGFYSAYPTLTVQTIRELTGTHRGGIDLCAQSALTVVLPVKSPTHFAVLSRLLTQSLQQMYAALDTIGTVYFLRFVPWGTYAMVLVAEHDLFVEDLAHDLFSYARRFSDMEQSSEKTSELCSQVDCRRGRHGVKGQDERQRTAPLTPSRPPQESCALKGLDRSRRCHTRKLHAGASFGVP